MPVKSIQRVGDRLRLLDQTRLPHEVVYRDYERWEDVVAAIRRLEVRGAPAIGIAGAYALAVGVRQTGDCSAERMNAIAAAVRSARPTAVNLAWAVDRVMARVTEVKPYGLSATLEMLWAEAEAIHREDEQMCRRIGEAGADLIKDGETILTHCNTGALATGGIGTALGVIYTCHAQGKRLRVYADETRPLLQGARLTAWELQQEGIDVTLICDNMAAALMAESRIDHVIVGADRIAANGDTANKIGTYGLALLAMAHEIPFYVAAPASTFDAAIASGADIPIELRSPDEITHLAGNPVAPDGVKAYNPAFDITPNELITCFITDTGLRPGGRAPKAGK